MTIKWKSGENRPKFFDGFTLGFFVGAMGVTFWMFYLIGHGGCK